jgi:hypothetical protein
VGNSGDNNQFLTCGSLGGSRFRLPIGECWQCVRAGGQKCRVRVRQACSGTHRRCLPPQGILHFDTCILHFDLRVLHALWG